MTNRMTKHIRCHHHVVRTHHLHLPDSLSPLVSDDARTQVVWGLGLVHSSIGLAATFDESPLPGVWALVYEAAYFEVRNG